MTLANKRAKVRCHQIAVNSCQSANGPNLAVMYCSNEWPVLEIGFVVGNHRNWGASGTSA